MDTIIQETENVNPFTNIFTMDIEFRRLSCNIGKEEILKSVSGKFSSGQLTGILGSSGAGKTTLLNVLAGHARQGQVSGDVYVNGKPRSMKDFRKMICYIRQEDLIQPFLTVGESMKIVANLKLSQQFSADYKESVISEILSVIGLDGSVDTKVENLSGGQRKRLIIALELISDPSLIFLDEPTTGLDEVAMRQCMRLLKSLSQRGATVICTVHQPSDALFKLFDTVYFMSEGYCIYNGTVPGLIVFLSSSGLPCPTNYNPADYIIEIVHGQETKTRMLSAMIANGDNKSYLRASAPYNDDRSGITNPRKTPYGQPSNAPPTFCTQFCSLILRNFLQLRRNKLVLSLHFAHNILCGIAVGLLFYQVGTRGSLVVANLKCMYGVVIYFMFTHGMAPILLYPFEVRLLEREYCNQWYSLKAYFAAYTLGILPLIVVPTIVFVTIMYTMTGQPLELYRFLWFCLISVLMAVTSQGFGFTIGALFNPTRGACIGSGVAVPLVLLGMQGLGHADTLPPFLKILMSLSFPYQGYIGITTSILKDRGKIECDDIFCYFGDSEFLLAQLGLSDKNYLNAALYLLAFFILHRILLYLFLKIRVSSRCTLFRSLKLFDLS